MLRWMYLCVFVCACLHTYAHNVCLGDQKDRLYQLGTLGDSHQVLEFGSTGLAEIKTQESSLRVPAVLNHHSRASQGLEHKDS